ncbi:MAG: hypothetical protein AB7O96_14545, partial [Pseudobdellovibrionaceae bacterium]
KDFHQSAFEAIERLTEEIHMDYLPVQYRLARVLDNEKTQPTVEELGEILLDIEVTYQKVNERIYKATQLASDVRAQVATFLNVNREIYNANRFLVEALEEIVPSAHTSQNLSSR